MASMNSRRAPEPPLLRLEPFKGMNLSVTPTQIDHSQTPDVLNMNIDERGALNKRTGYERIFSKPVGTTQINGMFHQRKHDGRDLFLFAQGTKIYTTDAISNGDYRRAAIWDDDDLNVSWESEGV